MVLSSKELDKIGNKEYSDFECIHIEGVTEMSVLAVPQGYQFSNKELRKIILPLVTEQFLILAVSLADSVMVSGAGEAAISAVSLMANIFILLINMLVALATGGCVVASQYIGKKKINDAKNTADQLLLITTILSVIIMISVYLLKHFIINVVFGRLSPEVAQNCYTYLHIVTASIPFVSITSSGSAMLRAIGDTKTPMLISILMNVINIVGNAILIYGFHMGIEGVAYPTLVSGIFAAIATYVIMRNQALPMHFSSRPVLKLNKPLVRKILYIGIPNSFETSLFQLGKIIVLNMIAGFGTAAIAANSIANIITSLQNLPGIAINIAIVSICARCFGAGEYEQVGYYTKRLMITIRVFFALTSGIIILLLNNILNIYNISQSAREMAYVIIIYYSIMALLIWPESFALPSALRAVNDVKYCMVVAIVSMWVCRLAFSYILGKTFQLGLLGVWIAMTIDWVVRAIFMIHRFRFSKKSMLYLASHAPHELEHVQL